MTLCHYAEVIILSDVILNVVTLIVFMPNAVAPLNLPSVAEASGTGDVFEQNFLSKMVVFCCIVSLIN
jgi:hypothetical protein